MKGIQKSIIFISIFIFSLSFSSAELPKQQYIDINDFAGLFSSEDLQNLGEIIENIEKSAQVRIVVAIVETTSPYTPQEYRTLLFNEWKVGEEGKDNGLLVLYSVQERRIEVEIGYGLEGLLPDSKVGRLLDEYYVPLRDQGEPQTGIIEFVKALKIILEENPESLPTLEKKNKWGGFIWFFIILFILIILIILVSPNPGRAHNSYSSYPVFRPGRIGGSSGGFGGGRSGGGGAGR